MKLKTKQKHGRSRHKSDEDRKQIKRDETEDILESNKNQWTQTGRDGTIRTITYRTERQTFTLLYLIDTELVFNCFIFQEF